MSKLKQDAYQAGKKRDWPAAITIYKQILELDKSNPALINELGDIYVKQGVVPTAIEYFLSAASKYRQTGLQNNALAIYKKILRFDKENLNAHWYLAEIRAGQGLTVEGEVHARVFLEASDNISAEIKEIHLKRCIQVLSLYADNLEVMTRLADVFKFWDMDIEKYRARCIIACLKYDAGQTKEANEDIAEIMDLQPEIANYTEYSQWLERIGGGAASGAFSEDVNALSLDADDPAAQPEAVVVEDTPEIPVAEAPPASEPDLSSDDSGGDSAAALLAEESFADVDLEPSPEETEAKTRPAAEVEDTLPAMPADDEVDADEDGCFEIDLDDAGSLADIIADVSQDDGAENETAEARPVEAEETGAPEAEEDSIDLLAEILGDDSGDAAAAAAGQLDTIASEIGSQVGGEEQDPASSYDMGMVYLEMGLLEQACECFELTSNDLEFAVRAFEMWGIALQRGGRFDDSLEVLERGLEVEVQDRREQLGLLYHKGRAFEKSGVPEEARLCYEQVKETMPGFLDVQERLDTLPQPG